MGWREVYQPVPWESGCRRRGQGGGGTGISFKMKEAAVVGVRVGVGGGRDGRWQGAPIDKLPREPPILCRVL